MTVLTDFIVTVKSWVDDLNPPDTLVTSWVRLAEQRMNDELRVDEMIVRGYATFDDDCAELPPDWLKTVYVRPQGGRPFRFISNIAYFDGVDDAPPLVQQDPASAPTYPAARQGFYTNVGRTIFVWPPIDPAALTKFEVGYYARVTPLDVTTPVFERFPGIYLNCTLAAGQPYLIEDERLQTFAALATAQIKTANDQAIAARFSGSPITPKIRSFG
jgi:hypothetical protein